MTPAGLATAKQLIPREQLSLWQSKYSGDKKPMANREVCKKGKGTHQHLVGDEKGARTG